LNLVGDRIRLFVNIKIRKLTYEKMTKQLQMKATNTML